MDTIFLSTDEPKATRLVVVQTKDAQDNVDHRQGNIDTSAGDEVVWMVETPDPTVSYFEVSFVDLTTGKATWPFVEKADGTGTAPSDYPGPIKLEPPATTSAPPNQVKLTTKMTGGGEVKYTVAAIPVPGVTITPCDPMLIIRPTLISRVTFGLICAVAGAIVGTVLALRPWQ